MAADGNPTPTDMQPHVQTYAGMINMLKWGAVAAGVLAFLVIWLIYK